MRRSKSGCLIVLVTQAVAEQQYAPARTTAALMFFPVVPRALKNLPPSNPSNKHIYPIFKGCLQICIGTL